MNKSIRISDTVPVKQIANAYGMSLKFFLNLDRPVMMHFIKLYYLKNN